MATKRFRLPMTTKAKNTPAKVCQDTSRKQVRLPNGKVAEFRDFHEVNLGDTITVDSIADGEWVDVTGISKGKGYQAS